MAQKTSQEIKEHPIIKIKISDLVFDPSNPNVMTDDQMNGLRLSLKKYGYLTPVVVDSHNKIADGEHRAIVYKDLGLKEIPAIRMKLETDADRRELRQVLNKLHGTHDKSLDADELVTIFQSQKLPELAEMLAEPEDKLKQLMVEYHPELFGISNNEDNLTPEELETVAPKTKQGDIWKLGNHKLICGDCTEKNIIQSLFQNQNPDIILTDPPYASGGYQEAGRKSGSIGTRQKAVIERDRLSTKGYNRLLKFSLTQVNADALYIFTDWRMWTWTYDVVEGSGYPVRNMLVWDKGQMGMGFPWRTQHELILFAKRTPNKMLDGKRGNVLQSKRTGNVNHPTEKPTDLLKQILDNTIGGTVYDPFLGSGSTMIACEQTNRICYACEIDPHYCDVTIARWEKYTGKKAVKIN